MSEHIDDSQWSQQELAKICRIFILNKQKIETVALFLSENLDSLAVKPDDEHDGKLLSKSPRTMKLFSKM